jgi:hypothetical protein
MAKIEYIDNFVWWLAHQGKLVEILNSTSTEIPVITETPDEYGWPYYNYAFVRQDQKPSSGVIKGSAIPKVKLIKGRIAEQDKAKVSKFIQSFGVDAAVAAQVITELEGPKSYYRWDKSIGEGTGTARCVTFTKDRLGSMVMWIRDDVRTEPDDLVSIEWSALKKHLPAVAQLEEEVAHRSHGHLEYNSAAKEWQSGPT